MDLLLRLVHELALEWLLCGQVERVEQVLLPVLVNPCCVIQHFDTLLLLEGKVFFNCFGHHEACKDSCISLLVNLCIVMFVLRVVFLRDRKVALSAEFSV